MKQTITIHELPPGLNGSKGLKNMHFHVYSKEKKKWVWLVREQKPAKCEGKVIVTFTRISTRKMDYDNIGASFKFIGDALEKCGVIENDSPDVITDLKLRWRKAESQKHQRVEIEIEDAE